MQNTKGAIEHIKDHQKYPASKKELIAACDDLSDFSAEDKAYFVTHITRDKYNSADEVLEDLHLGK
jgi:hypothetical protein